MITHLPIPSSATLSPEPGVAVAPPAIIAPAAGGASLFRHHHGDDGYGAARSRTPGNAVHHSRTPERIEIDG